MNRVAWLIMLILAAMSGCRKTEPVETAKQVAAADPVEDANGFTEQDRNDIQIEYTRAVLDLKDLLQTRGDLSAKGQRQARRDQLFLMTAGVEAEEAVDILRVFAERWPKAPEQQWLWTAYGWLGRDGRKAQWDVEKFVRWFGYWSHEIEDASVYWGITLEKRRLIVQGMKATTDYPVCQIIRSVALSSWREESDVGLIDSPPGGSDKKGWFPGSEFLKVLSNPPPIPSVQTLP
jgi:hypothetical protein